MTAAGCARSGNGGGAAPASGRRRRIQAVDLEVARRVRSRRLELGLTQQQLAESVDITYQQLAKCETGANRLSVGRLHRLGEALGVEVGYFFAEVHAEDHVVAGSAGTPGQRRMLLELVRHAAGIRDPKQREALCRLARDLAALEAGSASEPAG
jgi:transcriptional regulator with XRE-family HTH domain